MKNVFIYIIIYINLVNLYYEGNRIIISLSSTKDRIINAEKIIFSILEQNVEYSKYKIILILSKFDLKRKDIPKKLLNIEKFNEILSLKSNFNNQRLHGITLWLVRNVYKRSYKIS